MIGLLSARLSARGVPVFVFAYFACLVPFVEFVLFGIQNRSDMAVSPRGEFKKLSCSYDCTENGGRVETTIKPKFPGISSLGKFNRRSTPVSHM